MNRVQWVGCMLAIAPLPATASTMSSPVSSRCSIRCSEPGCAARAAAMDAAAWRTAASPIAWVAVGTRAAAKRAIAAA
ncbi:hypothetical protein HMPREF1529_01168 [Microbacterium sp. oral taxon 186 str. F0373]|nr:hypothetical protein [Microbacterium sp. oral taxon 186]EPD84565.1 hypothetical protein HMPREF1529_01168 [Microbacterium sp. oral taxon 186 str. F0373]